MQTCERKEITFTCKHSKEFQPHLNPAGRPLRCQRFRHCLLHMYFFTITVFCYYVLCYFCCHSTWKTRLFLLQSKCIKADTVYPPSAMRQDHARTSCCRLDEQRSCHLFAACLQFKVDQKACKKSQILSQLLVYVPSSFYRIFLELGSFF